MLLEVALVRAEVRRQVVALPFLGKLAQPLGRHEEAVGGEVMRVEAVDHRRRDHLVEPLVHERLAVERPVDDAGLQPAGAQLAQQDARTRRRDGGSGNAVEVLRVGLRAERALEIAAVGELHAHFAGKVWQQQTAAELPVVEDARRAVELPQRMVADDGHRADLSAGQRACARSYPLPVVQETHQSSHPTPDPAAAPAGRRSPR